MDKPIFRPLPSQAPERDSFVPDWASIDTEPSNIVTHGDCVGSASAPHAPLGARVAKPQRGYPCLTDSNSINVDSQELRYIKERKEREAKHYRENVQPTLSGYQNKSQKVLQNQIAKACDDHGVNSMAVLHLTFKEDVSYPEAQKRINSLRTNVLAKRYRIGGRIYVLTICEKGSKNGRVHFHVLVIKKDADFKTGTHMYWCPNAKKEKINANKDLREEWEFYREVLPKYGLGDHVRIEPLKSVEGGARYFSKYVGKGHYSRDDSMLGKQLIRPSNGFRQYFGTKEIDGKKFTAHQQVNWVGGVSSGRRFVVGDVGAAHMCHDLESLNYKLGSQWQHYAKDQVRACACLAGFRLGSKSKEFIESYAKNTLGIRVVYGLEGNQNEVLGGHYEIEEFRSGVWIERTDFYELAFDRLMERLEEVEEFQYDDRVPVTQKVETNNEKKSNGTNNKQGNDGVRNDREFVTENNETLTFGW